MTPILPPWLSTTLLIALVGFALFCYWAGRLDERFRWMFRALTLLEAAKAISDPSATDPPAGRPYWHGWTRSLEIAVDLADTDPLKYVLPSKRPTTPEATR